MVALSSELLRTDPAVIALGTDAPPAISEDARHGDELFATPPCQAARSAYRSALVYRNVFGGLLVLLGAVVLAAVAYIIYRATEGWDPTATIAAVGAIAGGVIGTFFAKMLNDSLTVLNDALRNVAEYCPAQTTQALSRTAGVKAPAPRAAGRTPAAH